MNTQATFLRSYYKYQDKILLVSHLKEDDYWDNRAIYLSKEYQPNVHYNHRSMLDSEVVIEYDLDNPVRNKELADQVCKRLSKLGISFAKFTSGNRSTHVHLFLSITNAQNLALLKKTFIRYVCRDMPIPDLQLTITNHLIRAEYGVHEKTGKKKVLLSKSSDYPRLNTVPSEVWDEYIRRMSINVSSRLTKDLKGFDELPGIRLLLQTEEFKKAKEGRSRALFLLIHALRDKYSEDELIAYLCTWYKYTNGKKLDPLKIAKQVKYYLKKRYSDNFYKGYLEDLLTEIGRSDLISK
jgi:hypothetical protein